MFEHLRTILLAILGIAGLLCIGGFARWLRILRPSFDRTLLKLIVRVLMPAFIFSVIAGNPELREPMRVLLPPVVGFASIVLGFAVAGLVAAACRRQLRMTAAAMRTFIFTTGIYNYGYIALPVIALLFGKQTVSVLILYNVGIELAIWTVGILVLTGHFSAKVWLKAINPPSVAIVVALICNWIGFSEQIPAGLIDVLNYIGWAGIPLGLILIGAIATDHLHEAGLRQGLPVIVAGNLLRLGVIPVLFLLAARFLPCAIELKQVMMVQAAMPAGVFAIIITRHYSGDTPTAMRIILTTHIICLVTAPLWLAIGRTFVGL